VWSVTARLRRHWPDAVKVWLRNQALDCGGYQRSVFLSGTGRGGTTWISELLNYDNRYRDVFEPFSAHFVRSSRLFVYPLYLRPDGEYPEYRRQARAILEGRIGNGWTNRANRRFVAFRRLIKEVRANLWVKWLQVQFPRLKIILLLRHPCAVADSRLRLEWPTRLSMFLAQRELITDYLAPYRDAMLRVSTDFEKHVMACCIHYYVPLQQFTNREVYCAFYEDFLTAPEREIASLFSFLGEPYDDRIFSLLDRPSGTTSRESEARAHHGAALAGSWQKRISPDMRKRAVEIMSWFGLDAIYNEDPLPSPAAIAHLANSRDPRYGPHTRHVDGGRDTLSLSSE
jgi:hypothetical protein